MDIISAVEDIILAIAILALLYVAKRHFCDKPKLEARLLSVQNEFENCQSRLQGQMKCTADSTGAISYSELKRAEGHLNTLQYIIERFNNVKWVAITKDVLDDIKNITGKVITPQYILEKDLDSEETIKHIENMRQEIDAMKSFVEKDDKEADEAFVRRYYTEADREMVSNISKKTKSLKKKVKSFIIDLKAEEPSFEWDNINEWKALLQSETKKQGLLYSLYCSAMPPFIHKYITFNFNASGEILIGGITVSALLFLGAKIKEVKLEKNYNFVKKQCDNTEKIIKQIDCFTNEMKNIESVCNDYGEFIFSIAMNLENASDVIDEIFDNHLINDNQKVDFSELNKEEKYKLCTPIILSTILMDIMIKMNSDGSNYIEGAKNTPASKEYYYFKEYCTKKWNIFNDETHAQYSNVAIPAGGVFMRRKAVSLKEAVSKMF